MTARETVRDYREGDLDGIGALQLAVEPEMRCPPREFVDLWRWMYAQTPFGVFKVVVAQDAAGAIVGHEGIMPFALSIGGAPVVGGITCNLIVAESLRGTLLFPRLVAALVKGYPGAGFAFGYGPTRPKMLKAMLALGYRDLGPLPVYVRPVDLGAVAARYVGSRALRAVLTPPLRALSAPVRWLGPRSSKRITIEAVTRFGEESRAFFEDAFRRFTIFAVRTPEILNWRYFEVPHRRYTVYRATEDGRFAGYVAVRRMPMLGFDSLGIVDLAYEFDRPEIGRALLARVHRDAAAARVAFVACMTAPRGPLGELLHRAGYLRAPEGFTMILHEPKGHPSVFPDRALDDWYVTWFDHDYV
ncbi:MAG TPA: hypothetical protein VK669_13785 [Candidatus Limnocylindrales bacterium]|nr:hypothetical protein [Candidatus Limnocylindrales bacterium]